MMDDRGGSSCGETVTRASLVQAVRGSLPSVAKRDLRIILNAVLEDIADTLVQGENVKLRSIGSFQVRFKRERIGRNPRTLEAVTIKPRRVLMFKPSPSLIATVSTRRRPSKYIESAPSQRTVKPASGRSSKSGSDR